MEDKEIHSVKKDIICHNCFLENFIKGGLEKILVEPKDDEINFLNKDLSNDEQKKNLKQIVDIYSINLNMAIKSLKILKSKYSKTICLTNNVFDNIAIRVMLSNYKENFPDFKKNVDNCKQSLKDVEENFENLIRDISYKEELKKFFIEGVFSNDNSYKNNLLKILKQVENEIEFSTININGNTQLLKNVKDETKKYDFPDKNSEKKEKNKNSSSYNTKNDINNNINNNQLSNIQNQKKQNIQNINEPLLLNDKDKNDILSNNFLLSQNNLMLNNPNEHFMNLGLGLSPNIDFSQNGLLHNNMLFNNLFPPIVNPQLLSQINNNNSIFQNNTNCPNNVSNDNNKSINNSNNMNNANNLPLTGLNGYIQRPNINFNSPNDSLKEFDNSLLRNIANNSTQNNLINNPYNSNLLSHLSPYNYMPPIPLSNFGTSPLFLYNGMGIQNNYDPLNLSQNINNVNNNNIELNKINHLKYMNINTNNKGINLNNINDMNNINNLGSNNLNPLNGLNSNLNKNEINNNNNILLYSGQQQTFNIPNQSNILVNLINCVGKEKEIKNLTNN